MAHDESTAVGSLVCGILSWFVCPIILAIVAIVMGSGNPHGLARAGVILGWLNIIVSLIGFFLVFLALAMGAGFAWSL